MSKTNKKQVSLPSNFLAAARADEEGALAYMFMASFGVMLSTLMEAVEQMIKENHVVIIRMCLTASTNIRENVTFASGNLSLIRRMYPVFVISSTRTVTDEYNYGALRAAGHILAHITANSGGGKVLSKAGSCITGEGTTDTDAGKINKETAASWSMTDKTLFMTWVTAIAADDRQVVTDVISTMEAKATAFSATIKPT
jgi:hypothetical protein